ncbi:MAG: hypothetical protein A2Y17_07020 [Clostridiales bacterium GWF2_38_85]|nr:MAG: hypothetical protein A2Y17_07020 [Clostridiales bacterium GWF2_38_85]HBL84969.1 GNAT family N-acetyltransferase [Clostridiales bacterium]
MDIKHLNKLLKSLPMLETDQLTLSKITVKNTDDMYEYASRSEVTKYLLWEPHINLYETKGYIEFVQRKYRCGEFFDWGVNYKADNKFIGTIGFTTIDPDHEKAELGYVLSPAYWHMGLMSEAVKRVIEFAFYECGFNRLELKIMQGNANSMKLAEHLGFKFEGCLRDYMIVKGKPENICIYSLLKSEYN